MWINPCLKRIAADKIFPSRTHAFFVCKSECERVSKELIAAFPKEVNVLHAFAAKANPLRGVLQVFHDSGLGCETASYGEFSMAKRVFPEHKIVFDSPVKTIEELQSVLYLNCFVNLDNFEELERVRAIHRVKPIVASVGLRVNPQLGAGEIGLLSTACATSKFGIGLEDARAQIIQAFRDNEFLKMLHVHTGSQGIGLKMMVAGVKSITQLAEEINRAHGTQKVTVIDIGGGLPVNFKSDDYIPSVQSYVAALKEDIPHLFSGQYQLITEFGRCLVAKAGILASRVEYAKENGGRRIVQQHIGADLAVRTVWQPETWKLRVDIYDANGQLKTADIAQTDVAGPCCLGGDLVAINQPLPLAKSLEDIVIVKDVGGYYHSSFSHYNMRQAPACFLYDEISDTLSLINAGQSLEQTLAFMELP